MQVIGFGALNFDKLYKVKRFPEPGGEVKIEFKLESAGGSAANTIFALSMLGIKTGFIGAVGDDEEGKAILKEFREAGVSIDRIKVVNADTGIVIGFVDENGERALYVYAGANSMISREDVSIESIKGAEIFHTTSFADDEQFKVQCEVVKALPEHVKLSFGPTSLYAKKGKELMPILERTDIIFLNEKEMKEITKLDYEEGSEYLRGLGIETVAVTLGRKGCFVSNNKESYLVKAEHRDVVDTTGAGDAFAAGFLYGIAKGKGLRECGELGNMVASFCIKRLGARAGLLELKNL